MNQDALIILKCTKKEKELLKKKAKESHLTLSAYIRVKCLTNIG